MRLSYTCLGCLLALSAVIASFKVAEQPAPAAIPAATSQATATWRPTMKPPPLESILTDAEYAKQRATALQGIDRALLQDPQTPLSGVKITVMDADRPADQHGLKLGDVVVTINGKPATDKLLGDTVHSDQPFEMEFWSPVRRNFSEKFTGGRMGIDEVPYFAAGAYFLKHGPHDARWDDDMLVACSVFEADPNLALAALFRASRAGYSDPLLQVVQSLSLYGSLHLEESLAVGFSTLAKAPAESTQVLAAALIHCSAQMNHLDATLDLIQSYPGLVNDAFKAAVDLAQRSLRVAKELAIEPRPPILPKNATLKDWANIPQSDDFTQMMESTVPASNWQKNRVLHYAVDTNSLAETSFGPALQNFSMLIQFKTKLSKTAPMHFLEEVAIDLSRVPEDSGLTVRMFRASFRGNGIAVQTPTFKLDQLIPAPTVSLDQSQTLEVIVIGRRAQVLFNNLVVFDGPFPVPEDSRQISGRIFICGMTADVTKVEWREIQVGADATRPK